MNSAKVNVYRAVLVLLIFAMFVVPWFVPVTPVLSDSYALGFSNRACVAILVLGVLPMAYFLFKLNNRPGGRVEPKADAGAEEVSPSVWVVVLKMLALLGIAFFVFYIVFLLVFYRGLEFYGGESSYFLLRSRLVEAGLAPYKDFEFAYGPLLLYGITALHSMGVVDAVAYWIVWTVEIVLGFWGLHYVAGRVFATERRVGNWVCLAVFAGLAYSAFSFGVNYTYFRFAVPLVLPVYLLDSWRRGGRSMPFWLAPAVFFAGWMISPELGIVSAIASFAVLFLLVKRKVLFVGYYGVVFGALLFVFPMIRESTLTILEFSSGGNMFPVFPAPHLLLFVASAILATKYIAGCGWGERPVDWFLYVYSVGTLPAALGRCDCGHVFFYGFGFVFLAAKGLMEMRGRWCLKEPHMAYMALCLFLCMLNGAVYMGRSGYWRSAKVLFFKALTSSQVAKLAVWFPGSGCRHIVKAYAVAHHGADESFEAVRGATVLGAPLHEAKLDGMKLTYFPTMQNACTLKSWQRIASSVEKADRVYVSKPVRTALIEPYRPSYRLMRELFLFPVSLFPQRHDPAVVMAPLKRVLTALRLESEEPKAGFVSFVPAEGR